MLKIKDNVDLKELEKYGFEQRPMIYIKEIKRDNALLDEEKTIYIEEANREISIHKGLFNVDEELDTLYDLIKDGLVEKVDEEEFEDIDNLESSIDQIYDNEDFEYDQYVENKLIEEYSKNLEKFD